MRIENTRSTDKPLATVSHPRVYEKTNLNMNNHAVGWSHPRVCRENGLSTHRNFESKEPSPTWVGSDILSDGDPQASYLAILVLTGNRNHLPV